MRGRISLLLAALLSIGITGCGSGSSGSNEGVLEVQLTDAPGDFEAVYVTIDSVAVHSASDLHDSNGSWITVAQPHGTYDLLTLQDGNTELLGIEKIPAEKYTQMRLILSEESNDSQRHPFGNYVEINGTAHALTVPSMTLKENHNFSMAADGNMTMTIDLDAAASIHEAGDKWILTPVLHVKTQ